MAFNRNDRGDSPMKRRGGRRRKKVCVFCGKENNEIDYSVAPSHPPATAGPF